MCLPKVAAAVAGHCATLPLPLPPAQPYRPICWSADGCRGANLEGVTLFGALATGADFTGANLRVRCLFAAGRARLLCMHRPL